MKPRIIFYVLFSCLIFSNLLFAHREPKPSIETTKLKEHFYKIFVHDFVNMVVFEGSDGILLVDSGLDPVDMIEKEIRTISDGPIRYIINTHSNGDHILGNAELGKEAVIISSTACKEDILKRKGFPAAGLPNLTFSDSMRLHFNGEEIGLYFMSGHTGNDIVIHFKKVNIVCVGDLVFSDSFPGIQASRGGNAIVLEKTFRRLTDEFPEDALFVSGHGRDYLMAEMKTYHDMIQRTIALVKPLVEKGLTLEEIKEKNPLKEWTSWNSAFFPGEITTDTWIENIYESRDVKNEFSVLKGPYLGQTPPGNTPEVFAPGIISHGFHELSITFSPAGDELFYIMSDRNYMHYALVSVYMNDKQWQTPQIASFARDLNVYSVCVHPDGQTLFFTGRPAGVDRNLQPFHDIYRVRKRNGQWGVAEKLEKIVNFDLVESSVSVTSDYTLYFTRSEKGQPGDIWKATWDGVQYIDPVKLGQPVNTEHMESRVFVAPDESYLLFQSNRPGTFGYMDLYICNPKRNGDWEEPVNLGKSLNSESSDFGPSVTPDGKHLFFLQLSRTG